MDKTPQNIYTEDTLQVAGEFLKNYSLLVACQCQQLPVGAQTAPNLPSIFLYQTWYLDRSYTEQNNVTEAGVEVVGQKTFCLWKLHLPII